MPTSGIYDGSKMRIFVDDGQGGAKKAIGYATTTTVDLSADEVSITHKDNEGSGDWAESKPKTLSGSISFEAYWAQTVPNSDSTTLYDTLFGHFSNKRKIAWAIKTGTSGDKQLVGYGYVTGLSGTATDKEEATFSGTITISGAATLLTIT